MVIYLQPLPHLLLPTAWYRDQIKGYCKNNLSKGTRRQPNMEPGLQIHHSMCVPATIHRTSAEYLTLFLPVQLPQIK